MIGERVDLEAPLENRSIKVVPSAPWFDGEYKTARRRRRKAEKAYRREKDPQTKFDLKLLYKVRCKEADELALRKKKDYFSRMLENAEGNPKTLYAMVNKQLDRKQTKPLPDFTDHMEELATSFNEFFTNKIEKIRQNLPLCPEPDYESELYTRKYFDQFEFLKNSKKLSMKLV